MSDTTRALIQRHWALANARQWDGFARLLAPDLQYDVPQTREYIETGAGYLEMFSTWPGDWRATITQLVCDGDKAVCIIDFDVDGQRMTGISVFELRGGLVARVTDYWPEPYEPPPRQTGAMKRRPAPA
jgi:predicted ester cyclase